MYKLYNLPLNSEIANLPFYRTHINIEGFFYKLYGLIKYSNQYSCMYNLFIVRILITLKDSESFN